MTRITGAWSQEEIDFLKSAWPHQTSTQIGDFLDRTPESIRTKAYRLKLPKKGVGGARH